MHQSLIKEDHMNHLPLKVILRKSLGFRPRNQLSRDKSNFGKRFLVILDVSFARKFKKKLRIHEDHTR